MVPGDYTAPHSGVTVIVDDPIGCVVPSAGVEIIDTSTPNMVLMPTAAYHALTRADTPVLTVRPARPRYRSARSQRRVERKDKSKKLHKGLR